MVEQAGIFRIILYERKELTFTYPDTSNHNRIDLLSSNGTVIDIVNNQEANLLINTVLSNSFTQSFNYTLNFKLYDINPIKQGVVKQIRQSIYGWSPFLELYNGESKFIDTAFYFNLSRVSNISNNYNIRLENRIPTSTRVFDFGEEIDADQFLLLNDTDFLTLNAGGDRLLIN